MALLRQKTTGRIFPFIAQMAARPDMEIVEDAGTPPAVDPVVEKKAKPTRQPKQVEQVETPTEAPVIADVPAPTANSILFEE